MSEVMMRRKASTTSSIFSRDQASDLLFQPEFILFAQGDLGEDGAPLRHCNQLIIQELIVGLIQAHLPLGISEENGFDLFLLLWGRGIQIG